MELGDFEDEVHAVLLMILADLFDLVLARELLEVVLVVAGPLPNG